MKRLRVIFPTILSLMLVTLFWPMMAQAQGNSPNLSIYNNLSKSGGPAWGIGQYQSQSENHQSRANS